MNHLSTLKKQRNMPFHDLVQQHFQPEELQNIDQILDALEDALKTKTRNLTPAERKRYGSINEANKLFVNKVYDYCKAQPALCSPDVDWAECDGNSIIFPTFAQSMARDRFHYQLMLRRGKSLRCSFDEVP
jgi:hypothetical protein